MKKLFIVLSILSLVGKSWGYANLTNDNSGQSWPVGTKFTTVYYVSAGGTNLVSQFRFGENTGSVTYDTVNTNVFATFGGSIIGWTNGLNDFAVYNNHNLGYLYGNSNAFIANLSFPFTIAYRINIPDYRYNYPLSVFWSDGPCTNYSGVFSWIDTNGVVTLGYGDNTSTNSSSYRIAKSNNTVPTNAFVNVVGVISGPTNMNIYIGATNQTLTYSGTGGTVTNVSAIPYFTAKGNLNSLYEFSGILDEFWTYSGALDTNTITTVWGPIITTNPEVVTNGLVGFWIKGQFTNDLTVTDWSGNGNTGYMSNSPAWIKITNDYALSFSGTSFVDVGNGASINLTNAYTFSVWLKTSTTTFSFLFDKTSGASQPGYGCYIDNTPNYIYNRNNSTTVKGVAGPWNDGNWHWYGAVYDATNFYIFRDGIGVTNYTASVPNTTTAHLQIAARNGGTPLTGQEYRFRGYNRVLSTNEMYQIYTNELLKL